MHCGSSARVCLSVCLSVSLSGRHASMTTMQPAVADWRCHTLASPCQPVSTANAKNDHFWQEIPK